MSRYLPWLTLIVGISLSIGACIMGNRNPKPPPISVTCKQLRDQPAMYVGHDVLVPTAGTEIIDGNLVWRLHSPGDPDVTFDFVAGSVPDPLPAYVQGYCISPVRGGPVRVINCR